MTIFRLTLHNLRCRLLSSVLTGLLVAIGCWLVAGIWALQEQGRRSFERSLGRFNLLVGPKGSGLQLLLNTCFHVDKPVGSVPLSVWESLRRRPGVEAAWPMVGGDNYEGYPLVGTTPSFLTDFELSADHKFAAGRGRMLQRDFEAVIGADVAEATGLEVGHYFHPSHGAGEVAGADHHHHEDFKVVGILEPTGTPHDRCLYVTLDTMYRMEGHVGGRIAAILMKVKLQQAATLADEINKGTDAMAVFPNSQIDGLFRIVGSARVLLEIVSWLVLASAGVSILVALYNSMADRRRDIAIIRSLGAPAGTVFRLVMLEAVIICVIGAVVGIGAAYGSLAAAAPWARETFGVVLEPALPGLRDLLLFCGAAGVGVVAALLPAGLAYRTDVLKNLRPSG